MGRFFVLIYILLAGTAYLVAPWLFYCWFLVMPKIPSIITPLDLLFGSSRFIAVYATLFSCWLLHSHSRCSWGYGGKRYIRAIATWFVLLQIGFAFAVVTNLVTWQWGKHVPGLTGNGLKDMNTVFFLFTLPFNLLFGFWFLNIDITDKVYLTLRLPEYGDTLLVWVDLLKIPWWLAMGWLIFKVTKRMHKASAKKTNPFLPKGKEAMLIMGWSGYLWMITQLNWLSNILWVEEDAWLMFKVIAWSGFVLSIVGLFSWMFFKAVYCCLNEKPRHLNNG